MTSVFALISKHFFFQSSLWLVSLIVRTSWRWCMWFPSHLQAGLWLKSVGLV